MKPFLSRWNNCHVTMFVNDQFFPCLDTSTSWSSCSRKIIRIIYPSQNLWFALINSQSKFANSWNLNTHYFLESVNWNYDINFEINESSKTAGTCNRWAVCHQAVPVAWNWWTIHKGEAWSNGRGWGRSSFCFWEKCPKLLGWLFYVEGVILFFGRNVANQLICR